MEIDSVLLLARLHPRSCPLLVVHPLSLSLSLFGSLFAKCLESIYRRLEWTEEMNNFFIYLLEDNTNHTVYVPRMDGWMDNAFFCEGGLKIDTSINWYAKILHPWFGRVCAMSGAMCSGVITWATAAAAIIIIMATDDDRRIYYTHTRVLGEESRALFSQAEVKWWMKKLGWASSSSSPSSTFFSSFIYDTYIARLGGRGCSRLNSTTTQLRLREREREREWGRKKTYSLLKGLLLADLLTRAALYLRLLNGSPYHKVS